MLDIPLDPLPPVLPEYLLKINLLSFFLGYVTLLFLLSLVLRMRFYTAIYEIAQYVARSCPSVFRLIHEHWFLCVRDRFLWLVGVYGSIIGLYFFFSRIVWPQAYVSPADLADWSPAVLVGTLILIALMVAIDLVLTLQTSVIDKDVIIRDLKSAEEWLGGRLYAVLNLLGRWNPIKNYADSLTAECMLWLNVVFRGGMRMMILQTALRLLVGTSLFLTQAMLRSG